MSEALTARDAEIGDLIAHGRSRKIECARCGQLDCNVLVSKTTRGKDHRERLRCSLDGAPFTRTWIGGYA